MIVRCCGHSKNNQLLPILQALEGFSLNIVDIIILAIFVYFLLAGMHKGTIASGLSLFGFAGAWFGAQALYQGIAHLALSNTTLMAVLNQYLEPESFFADHGVAISAVTDIISGGETSIAAAVSSVGENWKFLSEAFSANIRNQAFANIGITTMADYFNQTLWVAVFNVGSFIAAFAVLYIIINLIVSMLDHVISFPVLRSFDWLVGGVFGLFRASVVVVLVLTVLPALTSIISPEFTTQMITGSALYSFASQLDLLGVANWITGLVMG